jgi:hypothetical protein
VIVSLTPLTDFAPVPRVEIRIEPMLDIDGGDAFTTGDQLSGGDAVSTGQVVSGGTAETSSVEVPEGTDRITVWRRSEGRAFKVRGAVSRVFAGAAGFLDMEAGFDTTSLYEVECFSGPVSLGRVAIGSTVLPWVGDVNGVLLQQPLDPSLHVLASNMSGSWPQLTRSAAGELVYTQGISAPALVAVGPRRAASGVPIDFGVATDAAAAAVWGTLGTDERPQVPVWLIRTHQGILPRVFFAGVLELTQVDVNHRSSGEWSRFQATVDEVAPPAPGLVVSPLSYDDLDASFSSYDEMDAAFASYDDRDSAWEYAGAAGGF